MAFEAAELRCRFQLTSPTVVAEESSSSANRDNAMGGDEGGACALRCQSWIQRAEVWPNRLLPSRSRRGWTVVTTNTDYTISDTTLNSVSSSRQVPCVFGLRHSRRRLVLLNLDQADTHASPGFVPFVNFLVTGILRHFNALTHS